MCYCICIALLQRLSYCVVFFISFSFFTQLNFRISLWNTNSFDSLLFYYPLRLCSIGSALYSMSEKGFLWGVRIFVYFSFICRSSRPVIQCIQFVFTFSCTLVQLKNRNTWQRWEKKKKHLNILSNRRR